MPSVTTRAGKTLCAAYARDQYLERTEKERRSGLEEVSARDSRRPTIPSRGVSTR
ncbi:hypothetical protein ACFQMM_21575 [Saliphagus sp. GCM10025308]